MDKLKLKYNLFCRKKSDINEHLPTIFKYAKECDSVFETGVRGVISSYALAYGLLSNESINKKKIFLNDITKCNIGRFKSITRKLDIEVKCKWISNLKLDIDERFDLTFIDTWHVYGQLKRELEKFHKITNKYIIMHDTTVDGIYGETIRNKMNAVQQSKDTGISIEEINKGLWPAITEFLEIHTDWKLKERFTNNNGLTILEKIN